jgi:hypothetical protein
VKISCFVRFNRCSTTRFVIFSVFARKYLIAHLRIARIVWREKKLKSQLTSSFHSINILYTAFFFNLTNQRDNFWIIVFKFAKFRMIFFSNFVLFYSRSYLLQSFVHHTLSFNHVVRKLSLNHIFRDFYHFFACFDDQRRFINIIRLKRKKIKSDHFDEARRKSQRISRREIAIEIKIRLIKKMFEK